MSVDHSGNSRFGARAYREFLPSGWLSASANEPWPQRTPRLATSALNSIRAEEAGHAGTARTTDPDGFAHLAGVG